MEDSRERWLRYRDEAAAALAVGKLIEQAPNVMEREKRDRQQHSRVEVVAGRRTAEDNFFIPQDIARHFTYKFK